MSRDIVALQSSYADADEATYGSASMATMPMGSSFGLQHVGGSNTSARTTIAKEEAPPEYGRAAMLGQKVGYGTLSVCGCNDDEHIRTRTHHYAEADYGSTLGIAQYSSRVPTARSHTFASGAGAATTTTGRPIFLPTPGIKYMPGPGEYRVKVEPKRSAAAYSFGKEEPPVGYGRSCMLAMPAMYGTPSMGMCNDDEHRKTRTHHYNAADYGSTLGLPNRLSRVKTPARTKFSSGKRDINPRGWGRS